MKLRKVDSKFLGLVIVVLVVFSLARPCFADISFVTSRSELAGNDYIDWGDFGEPYTLVDSNSTRSSHNNSVTATIRNLSGNFAIVRQPDSWGGNFQDGDNLLVAVDGNNSYFSAGPIRIDFNTSIYGAGAQIQSDDLGGFVGIISAFKKDDTLLRMFELSGWSTGGPNVLTNPNYNGNYPEYAIFLGIMSTTPEIDYLVFDFRYSGSTEGFAINRLDIVASPANQVPLPGAGWLLGSGLLGLGGWRRFRKN
jgi:hypothetical protein